MYKTPKEILREEIKTNNLTKVEMVEISGLQNWKINKILNNDLKCDLIETANGLSKITTKTTEYWIELLIRYEIDTKNNKYLNWILFSMFVQIIIMSLVYQRINGITEIKAFLLHSPFFVSLLVVFFLKEKRYKTKIYEKMKRIIWGCKKWLNLNSLTKGRKR